MDMLDQEEIDHQLKLLEAHRGTLAHSLRQHKALGVLAPPALANGIHEAWDNITRIKAILRANNIEATDEVDDQPRLLTITVPTLSPQERRNRSRMLQKVNDFWIKGVLENSLHGAALIKLGMEYKPDAVQHPWDLVIQQPDQPDQSIPHTTKIIDVFDEVGGDLLILGAPGSGKTTMLLELARDLIERAKQDETYPMPVVFNLSSWAEKQPLLSDWLVDEFNIRYNVPQKVGKSWIEGEQVLLLLDGLDEVRQEYRSTCVEIINRFGQARGFVNMVVCSRIADYDLLTARFNLRGAVLIHPLTPQQIDAYLECAGEQLVALRMAQTKDAMLRELAESPLMLSIMTLAYHGVAAHALEIQGSIEEQRKYLLAAYVDRMFVRRSVDKTYSRSQSLHWLAWLACRMSIRAQTVFFISRLQLDWLTRRTQQRAVNICVGLGCALIGGLAGGVLYGFAGGFGGLVIGLLAGSLEFSDKDSIFEFGDELEIREGNGTLGGLEVGLAAGLAAGLLGGELHGAIIGIIIGLLVGLIIWRGIELGDKLAGRLGHGVIVGVSVGLLTELLGQSFGKQGYGLGAGLVAGLGSGGRAYLSHLALRLILYSNGYTPWNYARFLDYCTDRIFLRKVGGGYIFIHRMLMEYFAELDSEEPAK